jgi:hypothetical protein
MARKGRKNYSVQEKMSILMGGVLEKVPLSDVLDVLE